jgi:P-type Cu2+ transporter
MTTARDLSHFVRKRDGGSAAIELAVEGITCASCMGAIERAISALPGVSRARVNLTNRRLAVEWVGNFDPARILDRLAELGYRAYPFETSRVENAAAREAQSLLRCLGVAAFAAMNIMLLSVSVWSGNVSDITPEQRDFFHWLSALIALPAAAYAGQPFFRSAVRALSSRNLNMDVPITVGVVLALGMSVAETLQHASHAYFDSAIMLLMFLLAGRYLDQNLRRRTRAVAGNLAALRAETAAKLSCCGEISEVPAESLEPGDCILVRSGERIAADGIVIEGCSDIDQSFVTGETLPIAAVKGSKVYAGSLNGCGALRVEVGSAQHTLLDQVTRLLDNALETKSGYVRLADRAARLYAPIVHLTALATLVGWLLLGAGWHDSIITAIAVLIITCPCALGLAIPAAQVVASGALFRSGVLLNSADAIERLAEVDTVLFDKTGTLTLPMLEVANARDLPAEQMALAGRLAMQSTHPLAMALARLAAGPPLNGCRERPGQGVEIELDGVGIRLGSPAFCAAEREAAQVGSEHPDASLIALAYGDERHVLAVRQRLRSDAAAVVSELMRRGYGVEILSGDRSEAVERVASQLGIGAWHAGLTPAEKIARIAALRAEGRRVLMVGDGLNDAPSLAAADVSMSPVTAAHLSQAAADGVFLGELLSPVAQALAIARKARLVMKQNLIMAALYNLIAVPIAMVGLVTPLLAAAAMSGSSLLVTANALRAKTASLGRVMPGSAASDALPLKSALKSGGMGRVPNPVNDPLPVATRPTSPFQGEVFRPRSQPIHDSAAGNRERPAWKC